MGPTLAAQGIDKNLADRARKYAAIPDQQFETILSERRARRAEPVTDNQIGQLCVVGLADGRALVKELRRGKDGLFDLYSPNDDPILNVVIEWAALVRVDYRGSDDQTHRYCCHFCGCRIGGLR